MSIAAISIDTLSVAQRRITGSEQNWLSAEPTAEVTGVPYKPDSLRVPKADRPASTRRTVTDWVEPFGRAGIAR
jgi:hypothetical protein